MNTSIINGLARHVLTLWAGGLATAGYVDGAQVNVIVGGIMAMIGVGWSVLEKRRG